MPVIPISTDTIRLAQFLKLAAVVQDGVEAKFRILDGEVSVNGIRETRRGRKLRPGDRVVFAGQELLVTAATIATDVDSTVPPQGCPSLSPGTRIQTQGRILAVEAERKIDSRPTSVL